MNLQTPNSKLQTSFKLQTSKPRTIRPWNLKCGVYLEFEVWSLKFQFLLLPFHWVTKHKFFKRREECVRGLMR